MRAKNRLRGDPAAARTALARAQELDPKNAQVAERGHEIHHIGLQLMLYHYFNLYSFGQSDPDDERKKPQCIY